MIKHVVNWLLLPGLLSYLLLPREAIAAEQLFVASRITPEGEYSAGIEGPAVDPSGNLFVVNFNTRGTIGIVEKGATRSRLHLTLPAGSIGNGIRFDRNGLMYVADYKRLNILRIDNATKRVSVYFHSRQFHQPNDLAISRDGVLYASDPKFSARSGQIWRIAMTDGEVKGAVMAAPRQMSTTNGLDLSPGENTLYVSESASREIWAYDLDGGKLSVPRLVKKFDSGELDGLRTDKTGRIFVARPGQGVITILQPDGSVLREVRLGGKNPTNLTFGGDDGKTIFVTQGDGRYIESFRTDEPGREFANP